MHTLPRLYLLNDAVKMYCCSRLYVNTDDVTAGLGKVCYSLLWVHNHLHTLNFIAGASLAVTNAT